ncbi:MAG: GNAT family N-acetyltransferase [Alphaproteobacteria bacterium]|nr:GNAT family N-acetyltransferase [Alphaproteobacteria bacterium]
MNALITIDYLENHPNLIPVCASWAFGQWGCQSGGSFERAKNRFTDGAKKNGIPLTLVAIDEGKPAGMISLWASDFEDRPDLSPWLASVYVHPFHRKKGIALLLVKRLEAEALRLGYKNLYLVTEESKGLYEKNGWQEMGHVQTHYGDASLMTKAL